MLDIASDCNTVFATVISSEGDSSGPLHEQSRMTLRKDTVSLARRGEGCIWFRSVK